MIAARAMCCWADESFLGQMCRRGVIEALVPGDFRDFCLHDLDLAQTNIFEALDLAQTPSLMAPFQVVLLGNVKKLYGRGSEEGGVRCNRCVLSQPEPAGAADLCGRPHRAAAGPAHAWR